MYSGARSLLCRSKTHAWSQQIKRAERHHRLTSRTLREDKWNCKLQTPRLLPHLQIVAGEALHSSNLLITTHIEVNSVCMVIIQQVRSHQNAKVFQIVDTILFHSRCCISIKYARKTCWKYRLRSACELTAYICALKIHFHKILRIIPFHTPAALIPSTDRILRVVLYLLCCCTANVGYVMNG
jgi:hypothetical protein